MRRIIWLLAMALCAAGTAYGQSSTEIFVGPSLLRNGATAPSFSLYGGWQVQGSYNFNSHYGVTADFGGQYRSISGQRATQYEYLFGPRVMEPIDRATLFVHGLVGANTFKLAGGSLNGFAAGFGGGLDYGVSTHFAVRVIQADYLRTRLSKNWFNNGRLAAGIVIKF